MSNCRTLICTETITPTTPPPSVVMTVDFDALRLRRGLARIVQSHDDTSDDDIKLINEFVFALCWCRETRDLAVEQIRPVIELNDQERRNYGNG